MLIALEGIAGSGKTTLRDRILHLAEHSGIPVRHIGQFSWLSPAATRTLVAMRTGRAIVDELDAVAAVLDDLTLHAHHNIAAAARDGHVLADRLILSSACLLGLNYPGTVARHLEPLVRVTNTSRLDRAGDHPCGGLRSPSRGPPNCAARRRRLRHSDPIA